MARKSVSRKLVVSRKFIWLTIRSGISIGLLVLILETVGTASILSSLGRCSPSTMVLALGCVLMGFGICSLRWQCLLRAAGYRLRLPPLIKFYVIGYFFNFFLPSTVGGDVARGYYASKRLFSMKEAYVSVMIERFLGLLSLSILAMGAALLLITTGGRQVFLPLALFAGLLLFAGLVVFKTRILDKVCTLVLRSGIGRVREAGLSVLSCARDYANHPGAVAQALGLSVLYQVVSGVVPTYLIARSLGIPVTPLHFLLIVPIVSVLSMLPITINGVGVREGAFVMALGWLGVSASGATAVSLLWFVLVGATAAIGGLVYLSDALYRKAPTRRHEVSGVLKHKASPLSQVRTVVGPDESVSPIRPSQKESLPL